MNDEVRQEIADEVTKINECMDNSIPVLHIFACWEFYRRLPGPGDKAACGWEWPEPTRATIEDYVPGQGNEHLACAVCMEITGQNRWWRRLQRWLAS